MKGKMKLIRYLEILTILVCLALPSVIFAAMEDYCQVPPFIGVTKPNLLLTIDNSASMWDLQYVDLGKKVCSTTQTTVCTTDEDCPASESCNVVQREPTYCYDESYSSANTYLGYFNVTGTARYYQYNFTNSHFTPTTTFPSSSSDCGSHDAVIFRANTLCIDIDTTTRQAYSFVASGNFLNWLTASKFDVQKWILTGGKYGLLPGGTSSGLLAETRGCVGRKYLKQPLDQDFQNYSGSTDPNFTPVSHRLPVILGIRGPVDLGNPSAVSQGGQTYIDIFYGNYNVAKCQAVIDDYLNTGTQKQTFINDIEACISYTQTNKNTCELLQSQICTSDADCGFVAAPSGACTVDANGACGNFGGGVCGVQTTGTCGVVNGTCTGTDGICVGGSKAGDPCTFGDDSPCKGNGTCSKVCVGGSSAGQACSSDAGCVSSLKQCTAGNVGITCTANSDCDLKWCTNTGLKNHAACSANADCNEGSCTAGKDSTTACLVNSDCNTALGTCNAPPASAGPPAKTCSADADCTVIGNGHCLSPASVQIKSTYDQSMHSCYQYTFQNIEFDNANDYNIVANPSGCNQVYAQYRICNGGTRDGLRCTTLTTSSGGAGDECPSGLCIGGPDAIRPGSPVLLCSTAYAGFCATTTDNWATTSGVNWVPRGYSSAQECVLTKFGDYCGAVNASPVTDPTNDPSNTVSYQNLPAIINDLGVGGQLGDPLQSLPVNIVPPSAPTGLIQDFSKIIRIGAMSFDFNGSPTECGVRDNVTKTVSGGPAFCSIHSGQSCTSDGNCPGTETCNPVVLCPYVCSGGTNAGGTCTLLPGGTTSDCPGATCERATGSNNQDGAHVLANSYIGNDVPVTPNGGHSVAGVINDIDGLRGKAWTPFSEAFYNAIGYYAEISSTSPLTVMRLNTSDFNAPWDIPSQPAPSQSNCQKNNVLLITDGQSTADLNATVTNTITSNAALLNGQSGLPATITVDTLGTYANTCIPYTGSRNMQWLSWMGQHRDIHDFAAAPVYNKDKISTYVVYSGTGSLDTASCENLSKTPANLAALPDCSGTPVAPNPDNMMCKTAKYGGGTYYLAQDPAKLKQSLKNAFLEIAAKATSGTAASVLASGEGSGANLIQALFYPRRQFDSNTETLWAGSLQTLWYYVDPFFSYSNIREDTPSAGIQDHILDLQDDYIANLQMLGTCSGDPSIYCASDTACGAAAPCQEVRVRVKRYSDDNGDGGTAQTYQGTTDIENINSLWEAGKKLWDVDPTTRELYTNCSIDSAACIPDASSRSTGVMSFSTANKAALQSYLQAADVNESSRIISWGRGYDKFCTGTLTPCAQDSDCTSLGVGVTCSDAPYRQRTVNIGGTTNVWRLGDVLNSTPKIASWVPLNTFNRVYLDNTYGPTDKDLFPSEGDNEAYFITSRTTYPDYRDRGMVFAGANDGMLHAFRLGTLGLKWASQTFRQKATLGMRCSTSGKACVVSSDCGGTQTCDSDANLGKEVWAFIPKNVLPFLKYVADPDYCHVYSVDLTPYIFDASIEGPDTTCGTATSDYWNCSRSKDSWRTILIGGMRLGGGCKARVCSTTTSQKCDDNHPCPGTETCVTPSTTKVCSLHIATACSVDADCPDTSKGEKCIPTTVGTAILDPGDPTNATALGYSSYFALDITETLADNTKPPRLMWEFSDNDLGFSSSGPAIVRIKALKDPGDLASGPEIGAGTRDGRWFVVFGSGPTGPISDYQFLGGSDQNLSLFVLDLKTGNLKRKITMDGTGGTPVIANAFSGSLLNANFDSDLDYQDDVIYSGYVKKCTNLLNPCTTGTWTDGGVGRLVTGDRLDTANHSRRLNPDYWTFSEVKDGIGPVTSSVVKLQDNVRKKLWVYFGTGRYFYKTSTAADDNNRTRTLYGIKEPCFGSTGFDSTCTTQVGSTTDVTSTAAGANGNQSWSIDMDAPAGLLGAERVITDPLATTTGLVFFTTFAPYSEICTLGGSSYIWALKYDTGGEPGALLKGKALVQVSTGKIEQVDLSTQFTEKGNRRTAGMEGVPPTAQGLSIITSPPPIKRVLHMKER
jgi:type IV pilus assembly protein PilY1